MSRATECLLDVDFSQACPSSPSSPSNREVTRFLPWTSGFADTINLWSERSKQRRQLLELADDSDLLKDLGLSSYDLRREGRKPFWRR